MLPLPFRRSGISSLLLPFRPLRRSSASHRSFLRSVMMASSLVSMVVLLSSCTMLGGGDKLAKKLGENKVLSSQTGIASFYGFDHVGRKTANGERFNPYGMTAAHKTLPFGSVVRVTCLDTHKSVVVRINDRGPYVKGRIIDLAREAAKDLDMLQKGLTRCRVDVLQMPEKRTASRR